MAKYSIIFLFWINLFSSNYISFYNNKDIEIKNIFFVELFIGEKIGSSLLMSYNLDTVNQINKNFLEELTSRVDNMSSVVSVIVTNLKGNSYFCDDVKKYLIGNKLIFNKNFLTIHLKNNGNLDYPIKLNYIIKNFNNTPLTFYKNKHTHITPIWNNSNFKLELKTPNGIKINSYNLEQSHNKEITFFTKLSFWDKVKSWFR